MQPLFFCIYCFGLPSYAHQFFPFIEIAIEIVLFFSLGTQTPS